MKQIDRVYAYQYGSYWSFTVNRWVSLCGSAVSNGGQFDLDALGKKVKNQPAAVRIGESGDPYSISGFVMVVKPLDWEISDFELCLDQLK